LKEPFTPALLWAIWKFVAVEVIVRALPAQAPVPTCDPRTTIDPAAVASDLQRLAVIVGKVLSIPLTQIMKAPKLGHPTILVAVEVIVIG
jgi:hypothetical protein